LLSAEAAPLVAAAAQTGDSNPLFEGYLGAGRSCFRIRLGPDVHPCWEGMLLITRVTSFAAEIAPRAPANNLAGKA